MFSTTSNQKSKRRLRNVFPGIINYIANFDQLCLKYTKELLKLIDTKLTFTVSYNNPFVSELRLIFFLPIEMTNVSENNVVWKNFLKYIFATFNAISPITIWISFSVMFFSYWWKTSGTLNLVMPYLTNKFDRASLNSK